MKILKTVFVGMVALALVTTLAYAEPGKGKGKAKGHEKGKIRKVVFNSSYCIAFPFRWHTSSYRSRYTGKSNFPIQFPLNVAKWLKGNDSGNKILVVYGSAGNLFKSYDEATEATANWLRSNGYQVTFMKRPPYITRELLMKFDQFWFVEGITKEPGADLRDYEISAIQHFYKKKGKLVLVCDSGKSHVNLISNALGLGVTWYGKVLYTGGRHHNQTHLYHLTDPGIVLTPHPIWEGITDTFFVVSPSIISTTNPNVQIIGIFPDIEGKQYPLFAVLEEKNKNRGKGLRKTDKHYINNQVDLSDGDHNKGHGDDPDGIDEDNPGKSAFNKNKRK